MPLIALPPLAMHKRFLAVSFILTLFLSACQALPADEAAAPEPLPSIKIGYLGPLTGDAAPYGVDTLNAVRMKVVEINANGGINGQMIELIAEDGRCTGADAASAAQKLISVDRVIAIIGGQCSSETLAAAAIAEAAQIPLISPVSSSPDVSEAGDFTFRVYPSDALKGKAFGKYFAEHGYKKVAMISENTDYCVGIQKSVKESLPEGTTMVFDELAEPGTKDFRTLVTRLKKVDFDVFFPNGQTDAFIGALMEQLREQGITQPALSQDVADSANLGSIAAEAVEGMQLINTSSKLGEGGPDSFAARFRAQHGEPQSNLSFATLAYDAVGVLSYAIRSVGTSGPAIRDFLYDLDAFNGAAGAISFDEKGDVVGIGYALKEFKDGKIIELSTISIHE